MCKICQKRALCCSVIKVMLLCDNALLRNYMYSLLAFCIVLQVLIFK